MDFTKQKCIPCEGNMPPLSPDEAQTLMKDISGWLLSPDTHSITKEYHFDDFKTALSFADCVGELSEKEGHHPDLVVGWGKVGITLSTHAIKGLSMNDFILAAKINALE